MERVLLNGCWEEGLNEAVEVLKYRVTATDKTYYQIQDWLVMDHSEENEEGYAHAYARCLEPGIWEVAIYRATWFYTYTDAV